MRRPYLFRVLAFSGVVVVLCLLAWAMVYLWLEYRLAHAPERLALEKRLLAREGCPLDAGALQRPLPSAGRNAAPDYVRLTTMKSRVSSDEDGRMLDAINPTRMHSETSDRWLDQTLHKHADVVALIHHAASRPECVFVRDWDLGPNVPLPEYARMRQAVRLLSVEAYLQARRGEYLKAVQTQALGFRIAQHAGSDPIMIGYLMEMACDAITLGGLDHILALSGSRADVAEAVYQTVRSERPQFDFHHALTGEIAGMTMRIDRMVRSRMAQGQSFEDAISVLDSRVPEHPLPPLRLRAIHSRLLDSMTADALHFGRLQIEAGRLKGRARLAALAGVEKQFDRCTHHPILSRYDPGTVLNSVLIAIFEHAASKELCIHGKEGCLEAGAKVLQFRARNGRLPGRLDRAISPVPTDPWSDGPLRYRVEGSAFVVYSVGPTGQFTGGRLGDSRSSPEAAFRFPESAAR